MLVLARSRGWPALAEVPAGRGAWIAAARRLPVVRLLQLCEMIDDGRVNTRLTDLSAISRT